MPLTPSELKQDFSQSISNLEEKAEMLESIPTQTRLLQEFTFMRSAIAHPDAAAHQQELRDGMATLEHKVTAAAQRQRNIFPESFWIQLLKGLVPGAAVTALFVGLTMGVKGQNTVSAAVGGVFFGIVVTVFVMLYLYNRAQQQLREAGADVEMEPLQQELR